MRPRGIGVLVLLFVLLGLGWWWSRAFAPSMQPVVEDLVPVPAVPVAGRLEAPHDAALRTAADPVPEVRRSDDPVPVPSPEELWGRVVVAGSGAPVAGAEVTLRHRDADEFWNLDMDYGKRVTELGRTRSAADGTFRFDVPRAQQHQLFVQAAGFAPVTRTHLCGGSEVVVELSRGATVEGVVRADGVGLVDVPVVIAVEGETIKLAQGRTAAGGTFRFTGLQPATVFVQAKSPDHSEAWQRLELVEGGVHRAEIDLDVGRAVHGRVVEKTTGVPIVDAELSDSWTFERIARTGIDGSFVLRGVEDDGFVCIQVRAPGYASSFRNVTGKLDEPLVFELERGGEVVGRLVDVAGAPVTTAYVAIAANYMQGTGYQGCDWIRAEVGKDGRFVALGLRPELHYSFYARAEGLGTRTYLLPRRLPAGERLDVGDVVLRAAGGVEGRVVDDAGNGLPGLTVGLRGANGDAQAWCGEGGRGQEVSQFQGRSGRTDASGAFRFTGVSAGTYTLGVRLPNRSENIVQPVVVVDGEIAGGVEIVVPRGLSIAGTIAYADGRAIGDEGAQMHLSATMESGESFSARVRPGGAFTFEGLAAGNFAITMFGPPAGWVLAPALSVPAGTTGLRLVLEPAAFVGGQVLDAAGKGTKARVWVRQRGNERGSSALHTTDDDGRFRVEVPASFVGTVGAHDVEEWQVQATVENVSAGQGEVVLTLKQK